MEFILLDATRSGILIKIYILSLGYVLTHLLNSKQQELFISLHFILEMCAMFVCIDNAKMDISDNIFLLILVITFISLTNEFE